MRKVAWFQCLSCQLTLTWGKWIFSHLLKPDWSIQIRRAPVVCKERTTMKYLWAHAWSCVQQGCSVSNVFNRYLTLLYLTGILTYVIFVVFPAVSHLKCCNLKELFGMCLKYWLDRRCRSDVCVVLILIIMARLRKTRIFSYNLRPRCLQNCSNILFTFFTQRSVSSYI